MSEPRTQPDPQPDLQPDESDAQFDARLKDALNARHMPPGLAEKTMARIHTHAQAVAQPPAAQPSPTAPSRKPASRRPVTRRRFVQLMAACIATSALAVGGGAIAFADETAQVEIDGSAVIELGLNRWDRVVRVWASDDALASALSALGLVGMSCADALAAIANGSMAADLLGHGDIELVACSGNAGQLQSALGACTAAAGRFGPNTACSTADPQTRAEARAVGMGVARYQVYCEIAAIEPSYTAEKCASMSMRELRDLLAKLGGETPEGAGHAGQGQGFGGGNGQGAGNTNGTGTGRGSGGGRGQGAGMGPGANGAHEE